MKPTTARVLALLRRHPQSGVTPLQAQQAIGTMRLAARVWELRDAGYDVRTEYRSFNGARFAVYRIVEKPEQLEAFG